MAWTYYFLKDEFDKVSPLINERIIEEVNRNLINPYFARDDYWWMGFGDQQVNNWNPWINYNVLQALMLIEKDPERVRQGVWKLMKSGVKGAFGWCVFVLTFLVSAIFGLSPVVIVVAAAAAGVIAGYAAERKGEKS